MNKKCMNNKYVTLIIFFFSFHEIHTFEKLAILHSFIFVLSSFS